jgi:hypothetical protein
LSPSCNSGWHLETLEGCQLAIAGYPLFHYDARAGGGPAEAVEQAGSGGDPVLQLQFDREQLQIPPLNRHTTRLLGVPLPPGLSISILPKALGGEVNRQTGVVQLRFEAAFRFRVHWAGRCLLAPPDLTVMTTLSSQGCISQRHRRRGDALSGDGLCTLVGVAEVPRCGAPWLDCFLGLPDEALAVLRCRLSAIQAP